MNTTITRQQLHELTALVEDAAAITCDTYLMSGECVWTIISCLSAAKLSELTGQVPDMH